MNKVVTLVAGVLAFSGCASNDPVHNSFYREAGSIIDSGIFGVATLNNTLIQSGQRDYAVTLHRRFEAHVPTTINFAFNSTALDEEPRAFFRAQADFIRQFPEVTFRIYGHTDLVGSKTYNRRLGLRRAEAAVLYLQSQGISRNRLEAVVSHGENQPLIVTEGRERANRRTVTEVSGFVQNDNRVLDGRYAEIIFREYVTSSAPS